LNSVRVNALMDVPRIPLPKGSWSRMVVNRDRAEGNASSLGYSVFLPGTVTSFVKHAVEETAFVVAGRGELRLDDGAVAFGPNDALFIPSGVWHAVANTGEADVIMVFAFPHPDYPPTERR
jgi:quercetin dioxygenase-like cupin family protein